MDEGHNRSANQRRRVSVSSSPLPSDGAARAWESPPQPLWMISQRPGQDCVELSPPSRYFEELYCSSQSSSSLVPLSRALVASSAPQRDVVKLGYLGKLERSHRRYFVLRAGSHTGPSRLEWYKSQENFTTVEKSASKAALFGSSKQGVIYLRCCLGVSRTGSTKRGHTVALYAKAQTMVLVAEDEWEQEEWYQAVRKLMEEERREEGFTEEDDGYCTLPPAAFFKEVWPVTVKSRGLGSSRSLSGESRLCLTTSSLVLFRVSASVDLPSVSIPLLIVRRFGHLDGSFFLELGRSAPTGPGEIWMEARDQGSPAVAQHIHEVVREAVRALRALPDFSRSPTSSSQLQNLLVSKRCRPKYREKPANPRPLCSRPPPRTPGSPILCSLESCRPDRSECPRASCLSPSRSHQSPDEMKRCPTGGQGRGYMMMSPKGSSSSVLPQDEYMTMTSPRKHDWPAGSSRQTSFNSFASECDSPLDASHHQTTERTQLTSVQQSDTKAGQSQGSSSTGPQDGAEQTRSAGGPDTRGPDWAGPNSGKAVSGRSVRRRRLMSCLPSCLQAEDS